MMNRGAGKKAGRKGVVMCNLAGYVGSEKAAPVLIELLSRQEGWAGGYYTGLATVHEGKLHTRKVVGDLAELLRTTDAAELPGNAGIIHSRSKSGGDREWGHPFISGNGKLAYVANGHLGFFEPAADVPGIASRLAADGCVFRSETHVPIGSYPAISPGRWVHFSELMCHLIDSERHHRESLLQGMGSAFEQFPAEIVGLTVTAEQEDAVYAARINQPMMMGRDARGMYLGTTAMAFPETVSWISPIPPNSAARISATGVEIVPFSKPAGPVTDLIPWREIEEAMLACLADGKAHGLGELGKAGESAWPTDAASQRDFSIYELLRKWRSSGRIRIEVSTRPGVSEGTQVPFRAAVLDDARQ